MCVEKCPLGTRKNDNGECVFCSLPSVWNEKSRACLSLDGGSDSGYVRFLNGIEKEYITKDDFDTSKYTSVNIMLDDTGHNYVLSDDDEFNFQLKSPSKEKKYWNISMQEYVDNCKAGHYSFSREHQRYECIPKCSGYVSSKEPKHCEDNCSMFETREYLSLGTTKKCIDKCPSGYVQYEN